METLDWTKLACDVVPDSGKIPYEPNKHLFRKVGFDVFQMNSSPVESLWILEDGDDGKQYLSARYDDTESETIEVKSSWNALADRKGENITLMYKDEPIQRFASSDYGFNKDDIHIFQQSLVELLNSDPNFVKRVLKSQSKERLGIIAQHFPELNVVPIK